MKILHTCESYYPSIGGVQEAVRQISENLVKLGHDVTVATRKLPNRKKMVFNGVKIMEFNISGNFVNGYIGDTNLYKKFLLDNKFDIVMNYAAQQWASDLFFEVIDQVKSKKVFVPCGFSSLYNLNYINYYKQMPSILRKYDATVYLSNNYRDINFAKKNKIKNSHIITNGASHEEFTKNYSSSFLRDSNILKKNKIIINIASFTGLKGQQSAIKVFHKSKIRNVVFVLIGDNVNRKYYRNTLILANLYNLLDFFKNKQIKILNLKRKQTIEALKLADLFLFTSNIECSPIVLFEAMASKTPILSVDVGNSKEILSWSKSGRILPTIKNTIGFSFPKISESALLLKKFIENENELKKLANNGYNIWKKSFTWKNIAKQYEKLYLSILE